MLSINCSTSRDHDVQLLVVPLLVTVCNFFKLCYMIVLCFLAIFSALHVFLFVSREEEKILINRH